MPERRQGDVNNRKWGKVLLVRRQAVGNAIWDALGTGVSGGMQQGTYSGIIALSEAAHLHAPDDQRECKLP